MPLTLPDLIAQGVMLLLILLAVKHRRLIDDCADMNVERLERDDRATEAKWWLNQMNRNQKETT